MKNIFLGLSVVLALTACDSNKTKYVLNKDAFCSGLDNNKESVICKDASGAEIAAGRVIEYFPNGKIYRSIQIKNGTLDGLSQIFYENGKIKSEYFFANEKTLRKEYSEDGVLRDVMNYTDNKFDGERTIYYSDGTTERQIHEQGQLISAKKYNKEGLITYDYDVKTKTGIGYEYNEYGILVEKAEFQDFKEINSEKIPAEQIEAECQKRINICQGNSFKDIKKGCKTIAVNGKVVAKSGLGIQIEDVPNVIIKTKKDYNIGDMYETSTYIEYVKSHKYRPVHNPYMAIDVYEFEETKLPICK